MSCGKYTILRSEAPAGATVPWLLQIANVDGERLVPEDLSTLTVTVYDDDGRVVVSESTLTISDHVLADYVTDDSRWDLDSVGYNVRYDVTAPSTGETREWRLKATQLDGSVLVTILRVRGV